MIDEPANTEPKQDTRFKPGQSGNPAGKKPGTRHKVTMAVEALLGDQHEQLTQVAVDKALEGDMTAMRLCLDRIAPPKKDGPISVPLPKVETIQDAVAASQAVLESVSNGEITPDEAGRVMALLATHKQLTEAGSIEQRLIALEEAQASGR